MKKIVVLGSNSFSGQDFIDLLLETGRYRVIGVSRRREARHHFLRYRQRTDLSSFRFVQADLNRDMNRLLTFLDEERPDCIVNFAAQSEVAPSWEHPGHWFQTNCVALAQLVNHLRQQGYLSRYLHISSPEVYGTSNGRVTEEAPLNPSTPYAVSKAAADLLLLAYHRQFGFPLVTVRATNVYGARQQLFKIIPRSALYMKQDRTILLHGGGKAVKSYIHVRDVSRGELAILERGQDGQVYHLSPDGGIAVCDLVGMICERLGKSFQQATRAVNERPGQDAAYVIDSSRAREELSWAPLIGLEEGLGEVLKWLDLCQEEILETPSEYVHQE